MKIHSLKKYLLLLICYTVCTASQSLCMRAGIGVIPVWDAVTLNLTEITGIKVGYFSMALNFTTIAIWFFLLRKEFKPVRLLSIALTLFYGFGINFFYYNVFNFEISNYVVRLALFICGNLLLAMALSVITYIDLISFPLEGLCYTLECRFKFPLKISRTLLDLFCIVVSLLLSFIFSTSLKIREGTVISMLMVGPLMGVGISFIKKHIKKEER